MTANYQRKSRSTAAFTIFEIIIVIAIIFVLVGLLLPAVQTSRERARQMSCQTKLRSLWLATESYRSKYQVYPAGSMAKKLPVVSFPADNYQGWLLRIMPEISGGRNWLSGFDYSKSVFAPVNWPIAFKSPEMLICNSSPLRGYFAFEAITDYVGIYDGRDAPLDANTRGAFVVNRFLVMEEFSDGLSQTLLLGEAAESPDALLGWTAGTPETLRTTMMPPYKPERSNAMIANVRAPYGWYLGDGVESYEQFVDSMIERAIKSRRLNPTELTPEGTGYTMASKERALASVDLDRMIFERWELESTAAGLQSATEGMLDSGEPEVVYPIPLIGQDRLIRLGVSSHHPGGVNVVFVDGSSRLFTSNVDDKLFSSIGIRDDAAPLMVEPQ